MKKLILMILSLSLILFNTAHSAEIRLNITSPVKNTHYFLCIYGEGCINIANHSKSFPLNPIDMGNIRKFAITDMTNMKMYTQDSNPSCHFKVKDNQTVKISGNLVVKNSTPYINNLRCNAG